MTQQIPPHASQTHNAQGPTVPRAIRDNAQKPGTVTFIHSDKSKRVYDYPEFSGAVDNRAMQLLEMGLEKGDRIGFVIPDSEDFVISFIAALTAGVIPVPMYPPLSLGRLDGYIDTAARILMAADAKALLTVKKAQPVLWSLVNRVDTLEKVVCLEDLPKPSGEQPDVDAISLDDVAFLQFTSGSTSDPKGVVVTHGSLLANMHAILKYGLEINPQDITVSWLPLYHDMGLIGFTLCPLWYAMSAVYIPTLDFVKHPTLWMETMHEHRGTIAFAPNFAYALATRRTSEKTLAKLDLSCVKVLGCGAEPNHPATLRAFTDLFAKAGLKPGALLPCYGMAEATLAMTFNPLHRGLRTDVIDADTYHGENRAVPKAEGHTLEFVSCGVPLPGHNVIIVDDDGKELPERSVGNIVFQGPSITSGYWGQKKATEDAFRDNGLHTGDLGYMADGELYVTGRKKDIIILNGRNYDPQSIEWEASEVDGVRKGNVVAFSRPSETTEELVIVVETKPGTNQDELAENVRQRIQNRMYLSVADVVLLASGQLPKTSSGKLQRSRARLQYLDGTLGAEGNRTLGNRGQVFTLVKHLSVSFLARLRHGVRRRVARILPETTRRHPRTGHRA